MLCKQGCGWLYRVTKHSYECQLCGIFRMVSRGVPRILEGGGQFFFKFGNLHVAKLGGFGGMLSREIFLKRCNLVRFRVYFDQILSLFFFKKLPFSIEKINILDKRLLWGISHEEIFENMLRLIRFGVYFETKMAIFTKE